MMNGEKEEKTEADQEKGKVYPLSINGNYDEFFSIYIIYIFSIRTKPQKLTRLGEGQRKKGVTKAKGMIM